MTSSVYPFRIVEMTLQLFTQLDATLVKYYRERWPTQMEDFIPVTSRDPVPNHSPLQMIANSYTVVKNQYPTKQDYDILSAIILFYYSTVVLEYYVLKEAQHYKIILQQKYISEDGSLIVTQDDQVFLVHEASATKCQTGLLPINKVVFDSTHILPSFRQMEKQERRETLMTLSKQLKEASLSHHLSSHRFFLKRNDPYKFIWSISEDPEYPLCQTQATVNGFFRKFQNKEINSLLFQISSDDLEWSRQLRRQFHGMN